jgi:hypothetical protein
MDGILAVAVAMLRDRTFYDPSRGASSNGTGRKVPLDQEWGVHSAGAKRADDLKRGQDAIPGRKPGCFILAQTRRKNQALRQFG